jgi:hypothetical protein
MNIYIACALTHVPRELFVEYTAFIHCLGRTLRDAGDNDVAYALVNSDPQLAAKPFEERARLCYVWDRELVQNADLVIAEASFPSTGLGIELQIAESAGVPIILCFKRNDSNRAAPICYENPDHNRHMLQIGEGYVSLMALGLPTVFKVISYETEQVGIGAILESVHLLNRGKLA